MFQQYVEECKCVEEATSYLEIYNYSVSFSFLLLHCYFIFDVRLLMRKLFFPYEEGGMLLLSYVPR